MTVSLKLNETKRRMVYVSLKRTETDIHHWSEKAKLLHNQFSC
jgi:hypothetical protein